MTFAETRLPQRPKVYLASGLFSPTERRFNEELCEILETACTVFLPQRDGALVDSLRQKLSMKTGAACNEVFMRDIAAIKDADVVVAVLEGRSYDEGVCVELGFARALNKYIVGFKSDIRMPLPWGENPMVGGCVDVWVRSTNELREWLYSTIRQE